MRPIVGALILAVISLLGLQVLPPGRPEPPHNVILFVPDGLRALSVTPQSAPALAELRDRGVNFRDPHSLLPTFTTANASAMATGHQLGDTGNFSNTIYAGVPIRGSVETVTPFLEHDNALAEMDAHFGGDYLNQETVLLAARRAGYRTAAVGKLGPTLIFDHTERTGASTVIVDDTTGRPGGIPLSDAMRRRLTAAGLPLQTPPRGGNGESGNATTPGTQVANVTQQDYFVDVITRAILPEFKESGRPFLLVFWSRDPDGSQHNHGDSLNRLEPGINGPTSQAGVRNADAGLARIRAALDAHGLAATTNIIVAADHGFSTISKASATSGAARAAYPKVPASLLPPGFLAIDIAAALRLPLFDADKSDAPVGAGAYPERGNGLIGPDPKRPQVVVAANGGSNLVYVTGDDTTLPARIVDFLGTQDYVSGIFMDDAAGDLPGTLPMSAISLIGSATTPRPTFVVSFRSFATGCEVPVMCAVEVSDSTLQQGQGMHGSFSRADTMNFMAAIGPDFKDGFVDELPVSNADVGRTLAHLLGLTIQDRGSLVGRVLAETLKTTSAATPAPPAVEVRRAARAAGGVRTEVHFKSIGSVRYIDAAGTPGRTQGLGQAPAERGRTAATAALPVASRPFAAPR